MEMYKEALRKKLRFVTPKGSLDVEQLWDLSFKDLTKAVKDYSKLISEDIEDDSLSFLENIPSISNSHKLRFNILKDVYVTKRTEKDALNNAAAVKEHNEKILAKISEKQESALDNMSEEELKAMLK